MKCLNRTSAFIFGGIMGALALPSAHAVTVMGYFDTDYVIPNFSRSTDGQFEVQTLSLQLAHEIDNFRFFSEFEAAPQGADTTVPSLERAWAEVTFSRFAILKLGKEVTPTLWQLNHYPNITPSFTRPQMVRNIFKEYFAGIQLSGQDSVGFKYNLWATNNDGVVTPASDSPSSVPGKPGVGAKLGWENKTAGSLVSVAALTGHYNDLALNYTAYGAEANVRYGDAKLWTEYATAKLDDTHTTKGFYAVLSYGFKMGEAEIAPFFLYDSFTGGGAPGSELAAPTATDLTVSNEARNRWALGMDYHPVANISVKMEYSNSSAWNSTVVQGGAVTSVPASSQLAAELAYFFN